MNPNGTTYQEVRITANSDTGEIKVLNPAGNPTAIEIGIPLDEEHESWSNGYVQHGAIGSYAGAPAFNHGYARIWIHYSNDFNTNPVAKWYYAPWTSDPGNPGDSSIIVTPTKPTQSGNVVTIPSVTGVTYAVAGLPVSGKLTLTKDTTVTATPNQGYAFLSGAVSQWTFTYTAPQPTVVKAVTVKIAKKPTSK